MDQRALNVNGIKFIKAFSVVWLTFLALIPYFNCIFILSNINVDLSFKLFDLLFSFIGVSFFALVAILIAKNKRQYSFGQMRIYISTHVWQVFWSGVVIFYLLSLAAVIIYPNKIFDIALEVIFSFIFFIVAKKLLNIGILMTAQWQEALKGGQELIHSQNEQGTEKSNNSLPYD